MQCFICKYDENEYNAAQFFQPVKQELIKVGDPMPEYIEIESFTGHRECIEKYLKQLEKKNNIKTYLEQLERKNNAKNEMLLGN